MNLYRTRTLAASLLLLFLGCACVLVFAQRRTAHKLRAIGVVEVTTDRSGHTVAHLVPVAILEDGRFHDASIYKAHPRPLAVDDGVVYEVQKTGNPVGFVTLAGAAQTGGIWTALGKWQPIVASAKKAEPSASPTASASSSASSDGRPILHRGGSSGDSGSTSPSPGATPEASPQATPDSQSSSTSSGSGSGSSSSGDSDRPVLHRPNSSGDSGSNSPNPSPQASPQSTPDSSSSGSGSSSQSGDSDRPVLHRPNSSGDSGSNSPQNTPDSQSPSSGASGSAGSSGPTGSGSGSSSDSDSQSSDSNRPVLRRRAPSSASSQSDSSASATDNRPGPQGGGDVPYATEHKTSQPHQSAASATDQFIPTPGTQTLIGISDNQPSDERSYEFKWQPGEREKMEAKMRKLALEQLPPENAKLGDNALRNVVIRSFDLDLSNEPVMVLTAEVPGSYMTPNTKTAPGKFISRYITLIARTDYEQNLQRLGVSVTDSSRLDVAPRLELIDAVDVDGDGLAELMFREYSFDTKGYLIYGVGRGTVTKVFEGASSPLTPQEQPKVGQGWTKPGN